MIIYAKVGDMALGRLNLLLFQICYESIGDTVRVYVLPPWTKTANPADLR